MYVCDVAVMRLLAFDIVALVVLSPCARFLPIDFKDMPSEIRMVVETEARIHFGELGDLFYTLVAEYLRSFKGS
jgi:hypothetical protein